MVSWNLILLCLERCTLFLPLRCFIIAHLPDSLLQVLLCRSFWIFQKFLSDSFPYEYSSHDIALSHQAEPPALLPGFRVHCYLINAEILPFSKFTLICTSIIILPVLKLIVEINYKTCQKFVSSNIVLEK